MTKPRKLIAPGTLNPADGPTEDSLAREFSANHGKSLRFDHTRKRWHIWNETRWAADQCGFVSQMIREHLREAAKSKGKPRIASVRTMTAVGTFVSIERGIAVTHDLWDNDPWLLGTPGGTVDLRTGKIQSASPETHITKQVACSPAEGEPTRWLRFLAEATGNDLEFVAFIRRWCGYCLTGLTREHAFVFIYGPGGNGKSVLLNTVAGIMADYSATAAMATFTESRNDRHTTELAMLAGARFVTASETEVGRGWSEAKIKAITGGDPITAQFMRQDNFTYTPQCKIMVAGNHKPTLQRVDDAMRRRLIVLPFVVKPEKPDHDLEANLRAEWPQILQWMIEGCLAWQNEGLNPPASITNATADYFKDQDVFGQWMEECCVVHPLQRGKPSTLFENWSKYAVSAGNPPGSNTSFKEELARRGILRKKSGSVFYEGIDLNPDD